MTPAVRVNRRLLAAPFPYGPSVISHLYGLDKIANEGQGQTIGIIDAFDQPNAESDLATFSQLYSLPACTTANGCFQQVYATGTQPPQDSGWSSEVSLDIEWAHAIAPQAKILLVEAATNSNSDLYAAVDKAVQMGASVVSMSFSGSETPFEVLTDLHFSKKGVTFVAASGDSGNLGGTAYPASSPLVVAVGGTTIAVAVVHGDYLYELAWSGSGGGFSAFEPAPAYQSGIPQTGRRAVPDVSYVGDPGTGVAVYWTDPTGINPAGWYQFGGTSVGTPQWSAIFAIANSLRAAAQKPTLNGVHNALYQAPSLFHDVIFGTNGECGGFCLAVNGYDFVTGLGSPKADLLIPYLASQP